MYVFSGEKKIRQICKDKQKSDEFASNYIKYVKNLLYQHLPVIVSCEHFSQLVGMKFSYVCRMTYKTERFYRHFSIPKRDNTTRDIYEPLPDLKFVQNWILHNILENVTVSGYAKAYVKGKNLKTNAWYHTNQPVLVTMDIKNFFPSITITQVTRIFENLGYAHNISCFLARLCCLNHVLPQGAPTSPYLSNLRMLALDDKLAKYAKEHKLHYTRYADDLTFSGDFEPKILIKDVKDFVFTEGFSINSKKTRVARKNARQEVTGIVVNSHTQISREKRRMIRQQVYYIRKFGLDSHLEHIHELRAHYLDHLLGLVNFALFVNPKDQEMQEYFEFLKTLLPSKKA